MRKYYLPSMLFFVMSTVLFGFFLPALVTVCSPRIESETRFFGKEGYFTSGHEPYILVEEAMRQALRVALSRNMSLQEVHAIIEEHTHNWFFHIFPTYVDVRELNESLPPQ